MAVTGFQAGERARIDLEALDDPGASNDEDDNQQTGGDVLLHAPAVFELVDLLLARRCSPARYRAAQGWRRLDGAGHRALGSFPREWNDIHVATPPTPNPAILPERSFALKVIGWPTQRDCSGPRIARSAVAIGGSHWP